MINIFGQKLTIETFWEGVRFTIIGALTMILSVTILYIFTEFFGIYYIISATLAYLFVPTFTFMFDKTWVFKEKLKDRFWKAYLTFYMITPFVMVANLIFLKIFTDYVGIYYLISQAMAIFMSGLLKFVLNRKFTFILPKD